MNELKQQAINLRNAIKRNSKAIDNPALILSILSELDFFIENLEQSSEDD